MLEAVNSVVSNAPLLKVSADNIRIDKGASKAVDVAPTVTTSASAPYISPYVHLARGQAILQIRDNNTGDVQRQIPPELGAKRSTTPSAGAEVKQSVSAAALTSSQADFAPKAITLELSEPSQATPKISAQAGASEYAAVTQSVTPSSSKGGEVSVST